MSSWSLDWLRQKEGWQEDLAEHARQRNLGAHLVHLFRQAISTNHLHPGDRLPSTRDLMAELGVSRNTAAYVYEQLCAEGYVFCRVGSGTYVSAVTPAMVHRARLSPGADPSGHPNARPNAIQLSDRAQDILGSGGVGPKQWGAFMPGVPDVTAFPRATYARIINQLWRHAQPEVLTYGTTGGAPQLKSQLAAYLRLGRAVQCEPEQILITEGIHQALDLTIRTLVNPGDTVWMEEPGYWGINNLLKLTPGIQVIRREVDSDGMCIDQDDPPPKLIFTTPSHQYPLGSVMSLERRKNLLAYARRHQAWIVEDDYDSEFRFGGTQISCMQGMESNSPVIYIGTFSKTLFPGLRVGYMVLPRELVEPMHRMQAEVFRQGHLVTHMALAEFIRQGHYTKHIRKMRVVYARRREWLRALIIRYLGPAFVSRTDSHAGLHLVLYLPKELNDVEVCAQLEANGILARPLSRYYQTALQQKGLLLGYAAVEENVMQKRFFEMLNVLRKFGVG